MIITASKFDQNSNSEIPLYFKYTLYIKYSMEREGQENYLKWISLLSEYSKIIRNSCNRQDNKNSQIK